VIYHNDPQGSDAWLASRKGCITGSRFKDARDRLADKPEKVCKKTGEITPSVRGGPSAKCLRYAYDVARERCGGTAPGAFVTKAMQAGTEQEPLARMAYEELTGELVDEAGFITDDERIFGVSVDGLVGKKGAIEIKTMWSSETLFAAVVDGDDGEYIDQVNGAMWLLGLDWVDLVLWAPDLESLGLHITVRRIRRDEAAIEALEADLLAFAAMVRENEAKLRLAAEKPKAAPPELLAT
jgi:exodeoxyribonuclease (lambda-induced)